jgi:predicted double-glycine peptidase
MPRSRYIPGIRFFLCLIAIVSLCIGMHAQAAEPVRSLLELRQRHVVLQQWELSCGAAALATILRYQYGVPVTEHSVALGLIDREEYIKNPDLIRFRQGFSLLDMKRYVDGLGYEGIGLGQLTLSDLFARAPIIVPVNLQGFPHFVVFRGGTLKSMLVADPAFGNVTMSADKFLKGWINYKDIGHVGFIVTKEGSLAPASKLSVRKLDFVLLR